MSFSLSVFEFGGSGTGRNFVRVSDLWEGSPLQACTIADGQMILDASESTLQCSLIGGDGGLFRARGFFCSQGRTERSVFVLGNVVLHLQVPVNWSGIRACARRRVSLRIGFGILGSPYEKFGPIRGVVTGTIPRKEK